MSKKSLILILTITGALIATGAAQVLAGGPICPPAGCPPPMCMPPMCAPPCAPPPMMCGPRPCPPPPCGPNPLAMICRGALALVTGVIALPFKAVDCLLDGLSRPRCGPPPCGPPPRMACAPPICIPPVVFGPPGGMGYGKGVRRPVGFGQGAPRRFAPMSRSNKKLPATLMAGPGDGFFGAYW